MAGAIAVCSECTTRCPTCTSKTFLDTLSDELETANPGAVALMNTFLEEHGGTFVALQELLSRTLPNVISISLTPDGMENHWHAVVQDIVDKIKMQHRNLHGAVSC